MINTQTYYMGNDNLKAIYAIGILNIYEEKPNNMVYFCYGAVYRWRTSNVRKKSND